MKAAFQNSLTVWLFKEMTKLGEVKLSAYQRIISGILRSSGLEVRRKVLRLYAFS